MSDAWDDEFFTCAGCGTDKCVSPFGSPSSPFLIIGSAPADDEIKDGMGLPRGDNEVVRVCLQHHLHSPNVILRVTPILPLTISSFFF